MTRAGAPPPPPSPADVSTATRAPVPPRATPSRPLWLAIGAVSFALAIALSLPVLCIVGITGYLRLSSPAQALRNSVMASAPGHWHKKFAVHAGAFTAGLVHFGSSFFKMPPEPRAALDAVHGAEVGIYSLQDASAPPNYVSMLTAADKSMNRRGWDRIVGVAQNRQFVAVYIPRDVRSTHSIACCVVVLNDNDLVVASARGNLEPLLALATQRLHEQDLFRRLTRL